MLHTLQSNCYKQFLKKMSRSISILHSILPSILEPATTKDVVYRVPVNLSPEEQKNWLDSQYHTFVKK